MVDNLRFGAINKHTDKWEDPTQASKKNKYKCPDCEDDVVFCKGKKVRPYFKHRPSKNGKTSNGNEACCYYERQGESQQHKEGKNFIKFLLDNKKSIKIIQYCSKCKDWDEYGEYSKKKIITNISYENYINAISKIEYSFIHNNSRKFADVALLNQDGELIMIFEIFYTSRTKEINRPDPWCEINVRELLKNRDSIINNPIYEIICERDGCLCCDCIIKNKAAIKIQSRFRGMMGREQIMRDKEETERDAMYKEDKQLHKREKDEEILENRVGVIWDLRDYHRKKWYDAWLKRYEAAETIQKYVRIKFGPIFSAMYKEKYLKKIIKIQSIVRGKIIMNDYKKIKLVFKDMIYAIETNDWSNVSLIDDEIVHPGNLHNFKLDVIYSRKDPIEIVDSVYYRQLLTWKKLLKDICNSHVKKCNNMYCKSLYCHYHRLLKIEIEKQENKRIAESKKKMAINIIHDIIDDAANKGFQKALIKERNRIYTLIHPHREKGWSAKTHEYALKCKIDNLIIDNQLFNNFYNSPINPLSNHAIDTINIWIKKTNKHIQENYGIELQTQAIKERRLIEKNKKDRKSGGDLRRMFGWSK
tara:strand:- start:48 stop:1808 length:1761 start_codon:yes stop_codon:yes gene_type:complete